jgi:hypothetical protein
MTNHLAIWRLLCTEEFETIKKASKQLSIPESSVALYIRALYNAGYLEVETPHTKIKHSHQVVLIKKTGETPPRLNRNSSVLTDMNTLEEFFVTQKGESEKNIKHHKNLIPTLNAIIKIGKREVYKREIWQKAGFDAPAKLSRWTPKLIELKVLVETVESYRNSPMYIVDIKGAERLLELINKFKSHRLAFEAFKRVTT